jgi:hypothetical protein
VGYAKLTGFPSIDTDNFDITAAEVAATGVMLGDEGNLLRAVSLRLSCEGKVYRATLRAYREERDDADLKVQVLLVVGSGEVQKEEPADVDLSVSHSLKLKLDEDEVKLLLDNVEELSKSGDPQIKPGEFDLLRVELEGNGPAGTTPSVEGVEAEWETQPK